VTVQAPTSEHIPSAWDGIASRYDEFTTPMNQRFAEKALLRVNLGPGARLLDVACGSGALAVPAALRGAQVTAVDLAPTMIERLTTRARAEGLTSVEGAVMDAESLEFADDTFDVTASLNGISLLPSLKVGLREAVRVTKPGGEAMIAAFGPPQRVELIGFLFGALKVSVPGFTPPTDPPPLSFQLADPNRFRNELADAGLTDIRIKSTTWEMTFPSADHFWYAATASSPTAVQLTRHLSDKQRDEVTQVIHGMLRERAGGGPEAVLSNVMNIGIGRKP
jgi:ubiquinone/menaquinone biosynthesis C-methylase UbiE